jgi:hypothetical protein
MKKILELAEAIGKALARALRERWIENRQKALSRLHFERELAGLHPVGVSDLERAVYGDNLVFPK